MKLESKRRADLPLLCATLFLVALGIAMVYSASFIVAQDKFGDGYYFLKRQALYAGLGLLAMLLAMKTNYQFWQKLAWPLMALCLALLVAVLIPSLGTEISGARRWLKFSGLSFQPTELAKVGVITYLAAFLSKRGEGVRQYFAGFMPPLVLTGVAALLILGQPDFGNAALLLLLALLLLFAAGARLWHLGLTGLAALPALYLLVQGTAYRKERVLAFLDPWKDPLNSGFQIIQSYLAFGSGGIAGLGLGNGRQKLFYLPEAHTDFIFSVVGEELGFIGVMAVVGAFAVIMVRGLTIASQTSDNFGYYLGLGLTSLIGLQAGINMAVVTGLLPTKGLTLPFFSYGGSSLVINMVTIGLLLSMSSRRKLGQGP